MWIFGSKVNDWLWLYLPGLLALVVMPWVPANYATVGLVGSALSPLLILHFMIDWGHIYVTGWRTYFHPAERGRSPAYIFVPICLFVFFYFSLKSGFKYLSVLLIYASSFHTLRQVYGVSKWYQKLNGVFRGKSDAFLYLLCLLPIMIAHIRGQVLVFANEIVLRFNPAYVGGLAVVYGLILFAWIVYEASILARSRSEWNRTLSVGVPAFIYGAGGFFGKSLTQAAFVIAMMHAFSYFGLVSLSLVRVKQKPQTFFVYVSWILLTALVFGGLELLIKSNWYSDSTPAFAVVSAMMMTIVMSHFVFDAFLWKSSHPEAAFVYGVRPGGTRIKKAV